MKRLWTFIDDYRDEIVATGTFFVAAFTIILAFATLYLYFATRDLVKGAEDTARRQLRAYITLEGGGVFHAEVDNSQGFRVTVQLTNYGLTPAYGFSTWIMAPQILDVSAMPFTPPPPMKERIAGTSIIGPGSSAWINWYTRFEPNDLDEIFYFSTPYQRARK